jgi:hypothetical protein
VRFSSFGISVKGADYVDAAFVSVVFNYAGPFFLNRILAAISSGEPEARAKAYVYAVLALFCTIAKAESDVNHLWYGRRASTRVRSELMGAI